MKKSNVSFQENVLVLHRTDESENNPKEFINKLHATLQTHMEQQPDLLIRTHRHAVEVWVEDLKDHSNRRYKSYFKLVLRPLWHHTGELILQISYVGKAYVLTFETSYRMKENDLVRQGNRIVSYGVIACHTPDDRMVIPIKRYKQISEISEHFHPTQNKLRYRLYFKIIHQFQQTYLPTGTSLGPATVGTWRQPAEEELYFIPTEYALLRFHGGQTALNARYGILHYRAYRFSPQKDIQLHPLIPRAKKGMEKRIMELFLPQLEQLDWKLHFSGMKIYFDPADVIYYSSPDDLLQQLRHHPPFTTPEEKAGHYYLLVPPYTKEEFQLPEKELYKPVLNLLKDDHYPVSLLYKGQLRKNHRSNTCMSLLLQIITQTGGQPWSICQPALRTTDALLAICSHRFDHVKKSILTVGYDLCPDGTYTGFESFNQLSPEKVVSHVRKTLNAYQHRMNGQPPLRFIIHTFSHIDDKQLQVIQHALAEEGLHIPLILVEMRKGALDHRLLFRTDYPICPIPLSGTCLRTGQDDYLLFNNEYFDPSLTTTWETVHRKQIYPLSCTIRQYLEGHEQPLPPAELKEQLRLLYQMSRLCTLSPDMQHRPNSCVYPDNLAQRSQETGLSHGRQVTPYPLTPGE